MRIGTHIAIQIAVLVLAGTGLSLAVAHQSATALEARARVHGDERELEAFERFADVTEHLLLTGELVLASDATYLTPVAERQAKTLQEILVELDASPLLQEHRAECDSLVTHVELLLATVVDAQHVDGGNREDVLYRTLSTFEDTSQELRSSIDAIRVTLSDRAKSRQASAESEVAHARAMSWLATIAFLCMVLLSWTYLSRATGRPIRTLASRARSARKGGRFDLPPGGPAEVRELSQGFAGLVRGLEEARDGLEETVRERTAELERALAARAAFLANTSHELRTPMNAILGFADLMAEGGDARHHGEYVESIRSSGRHLLSLIEEVLDLSKIDAGHMAVETIPVAPMALLRELETMLAGTAANKGISLRVDAVGEVPDHVVGDPIRLRQILVNVTGNAIKFTEEGSVDVVLGWEDRRLWVEVTDSGIGIPEDKLQSVFEDFEQADVSATRRFGGTGLGLAISRRLARLMDGDLSVTSEVGVGSTFRLEVGAAAASGQLGDEARALESDAGRDTAPIAGSRILLVDDVATNRLLGRRILERFELEVVEATNGREAVERVEEAAEQSRPFDAVLLDLQMPEMDGYEAAKRLRDGGFTGPVLALSAAVLPEQRARALSSGCNGFVAKPFDAKELAKTLGTLLREPPSAAA